jgi:hypothetical protein
LRVTLAWTDAPGSTFGNAYNNDLNLTLAIGGNTYKGNVFKGQYSITGGTADVKNNVENIFLAPGIIGDFTITVTAANINSDGVPNEAPALDQDFALVALEVTSPAAPFSPIAAVYNGLFSESNNVQLASSGSITLKTTTAGSYSGALQMAGGRFAFSGQFNASGMATNTVFRSGKTPLTLTLHAENNNNRIVGTLTDGNWLAAVRANRSVFSKINPTLLAGKYTLVIPGAENDALLPGGDSYGTLTLSTAGQIKFKGALADGTKLSQKATIGSNDEWPFYVSLYSGHGEILGWLNFTNGVDENLTGSVTWIKEALPTAKFYPAGFDLETLATGSVFNPLANPLTGFTSGLVILTGGNLAEGITNSVTISNNKVVNQGPNTLTLSISAASGLFKGSIVNPITSKAIPFNGVLLQKQNYGSGYFSGTNQSGKVFFEP